VCVAAFTFLLALGLAVLPAAAQQVDAYGAMFDQWAAKSRADTAILVVRKAGRTVSSRGYRVRPDSLSLIGSMSKPITGACIATLIRDGKLSFATPMREALMGFFKRYGRPADRRFEDVTVEHLLTHRSGLLGNPDGDPIHAIWQNLANKGQAHVAAPQALLAQHLKHRLARDPGSAESYSNTGFVALTAIIEERSGKPYEAYCREAVLSKLGITTAQLHPDWRTFSGAGGWIITGADYLAFLDIFDPANPFLSDPIKAWIDRAQIRWEANNKGGWYSLGIHTQAQSGRWYVDHGGGLNSFGRDSAGRRTAAVIESFGYRLPNGTAAFMAMTPAVEGGSPAFRELNNQVRRLHRTTPSPAGPLPASLLLLLN
jgi:CubicO group peptidase (beta-lactamase class C family)